MATIILYAKDPDAAVDFYANALGGQDAGNSLGFTSERLVQIQGVTLAFRPKDRQDHAWPGGLRGTNSDPGSKPIAMHLSFQVDDVLGTYQACLQAGARATNSKPFAMGLIMYAEARTSDGHLVELRGPVSTAHPNFAAANRKLAYEAKIERLTEGRALPGESLFED